jgi:glycosyltransferase involved in cell wall biosynthesis
MKVWYVFSKFPAPSETFAGTDVRVLRELGVEVRAVNLRPRHPKSADLLREWDLQGLELDEVTPGKLLAGVGRMLLRPGLLAFALGTIFRDNWRQPVHVFKSLLALPRIFQVHQALAARPPDVLHLFWGHYASLLGLLVRRTHQDVVVTAFLGAYDLRSRYRTSATLARAADQLFTHAHANQTLLDRNGVEPGRMAVIYRGVDLKRLRYRGEQKVPFRLASVGRLVPDKGFAEVIEAFAMVQRQWPQASLCLIGDGPERGALEARARARGLTGVEFAGHLEHRRVFERLCEAEVFLFLSHEEHLPNVVKEAMAARCACVVSRTAGIEELVAPGEHGFVVDAGDIAAAAACVDRLFREPALRERLVARARAHLETHFDAGQSMRRYRDFWVACLDRRAREREPEPAPAGAGLRQPLR